MHPADVIDHVARSVEDLRERVLAYPQLAVSRVDLVGGVDLFVHFDKKVWGVTAARERVIDPLTGRECSCAIVKRCRRG